MFDEPSAPAGRAATGSFMSGLDSAMANTLLPKPGTYGGAALPASPTAPVPPPMFGAQGSSSSRKSVASRKPSGSFMGTAQMIPSAVNLGGKTLIGQ